MSFVEEFKREFIDKVLYYTQEEGLKDHEVADILGCSRATVNRTRQANEIPTANLRNRKDKECVCEDCNVKYLIRRKERRKKSCEVCIKSK
jgi:predicted transcriptional regulator